MFGGYIQLDNLSYLQVMADLSLPQSITGYLGCLEVADQ